MLVPLPRYLPPCTTHVGGCSDDQLSEPLPFKNFGTSVSSEEPERFAHLEQITFEKNLKVGGRLAAPTKKAHAARHRRLSLAM